MHSLFEIILFTLENGSTWMLLVVKPQAVGRGFSDS